MGVATIIDTNVFSMIILLFMMGNARKQFQSTLPQQKLFMQLVFTLFISLAAETVSRIVDGMPGTVGVIMNNLSNLILYFTAPMPVLLWVVYSDMHVYHDEKRIKKLSAILIVLLVYNTILSLVSVFTGWFFYVDAQNIYHRGPLFLGHVVPLYLLLAYVFLFLCINRNKMQRKMYFTMLFFAVPTVVGSILQILFYGLSLTGSGMALSILLIYFNIQDRNLQTDYLTGAYNRRLLDSIIKEKINNSTPTHTFSAILIDLDSFKQINDTYGHDVGDQALLNAVGLLRSCLREGDIIARYGGDEFMIILDISDPAVLEKTVDRLKNTFRRFIVPGDYPYQLTFSIGSSVYHSHSNMTVNEFIKYVDMLMYADKKRLS